MTRTVTIGIFGLLLVLAAIALARPFAIAEIPQRLTAFRVSLRPPTSRHHLSAAETAQWADQWIVSAEDAVQIIQETDAIVLDPRTTAVSRLTSAVPVSWPAFTQSDAIHRGKLLESDQILARKLGALGIANDVPVLVAGDPLAWGEDGRIVWMLRTLGHPAVAMVNGGHAALADALATQNVRVSQPSPASFDVQRDPRWSIDRDRLQDALNNDNVVVIDSRSAAEYQGKTPHGERRGGHVPGAEHLHFKALIDDAGHLLPQSALMAKLTQAGITADKTIITYCTGGVRSAWLAVVLADLGFEVKNYPGSMWEWASSPPEQYPLVMP
ncbi:MAG: rhodanese-like domain-containing protein [Elainellaceae cyanobacterium]